MRIHCRIILILASALVYMTSYAQADLDAIKNNPNYWSAEGIGTTVEEADHDALSQIARKIAVNVTQGFQENDRSVKSDDGTIQSNYTQEGFIKSFSFVSFQNVEMRVLQAEPNAKVLRWVAKSDVEKTLREREKKVLDFVETGKIAERHLQIDDALRNYYWALMLSRAYPYAIYSEFNGEKINCLTFLPMKIKSVISRIKVSLDGFINNDNRYFAKMRFTYDGADVSSVQLRYFDGQSFVGPLVVKDGFGEFDLVSLPIDEKLKIRYEYNFRDEAENLDAELRSVFSSSEAPPIDNAYVEIPVKVDKKKMLIEPNRKYKNGVSAMASLDLKNITPEIIETKERMQLETVLYPTDYLAVLRKVEMCIKQGNPQEVYSCFTPDGYKLFETLLYKTGKVSLVGEKQDYEFVRASGQVLGRSCKVKITFQNGKSFMENITFRFGENDKKIQSIAFSLTKKAEDDIFNAATSWPEVSRYTILQFMEDYQTAYALKRLDYIEQIFSDDAIIIVGAVLKSMSNQDIEGKSMNFGIDNVVYTRQNKQQYLTRLRKHFNDREYIHLTYEDNISQVIYAPTIPSGTAFAIQIKQIYNSSVYSDRGYLTLILDASKKLPIIHVRLWQPERSDIMSLDHFINKFKF